MTDDEKKKIEDMQLKVWLAALSVTCIERPSQKEEIEEFIKKTKEKLSHD